MIEYSKSEYTIFYSEEVIKDAQRFGIRLKILKMRDLCVDYDDIYENYSYWYVVAKELLILLDNFDRTNELDYTGLEKVLSKPPSNIKLSLQIKRLLKLLKIKYKS